MMCFGNIKGCKCRLIFMRLKVGVTFIPMDFSLLDQDQSKGIIGKAYGFEWDQEINI